MNANSMDFSLLPLFNAPPNFDGESGKELGMDRAERHASDEWKNAGLKIIRHYARNCEFVSANDFWAGMEILGLSTHENRASGSLFLKAARLGWIEKTSSTIKTTRAKRNGGDVRLWRSLLFPSPIDSEQL